MKIAFYFSSSPLPAFEPGNIFGGPGKWPVYREFFRALNRQQIEVYFVGRENYCEGRYFKNSYRYDGENFSFQPEKVAIDFLFDKSRTSHQPPEAFSEKTYNPLPFKKVCGNKGATAEFLGEYLPQSRIARTEAELAALLKNSDPRRPVVAKPAAGIKGKGILIGTPSEILFQLPSRFYPYLLQEFVDTSKGIPGVTAGVHDLRIIAANGKILMAALRTPAENSLLANVALGADIREVALESIPPEIFSVVREVFEKIEKHFPCSFYSMDFGVENGQAYLFEINDRIGFPQASMPGSKLLIQELVNVFAAKQAS